MYHQFKELADLDMTKEPMEVGRRRTTSWAAFASMPSTEESSIGLFAAGGMRRGHQRREPPGGNSLSDLIVFGKRAGEYAAAAARTRSAARLDDRAAEEAMRASVEPFDRGGAGENPYAVQADLQQTMQALVGIVRTEAEMLEACRSSTSCGNGPAAPASPAIASSTPAGTPASICAT